MTQFYTEPPAAEGEEYWDICKVCNGNGCIYCHGTGLVGGADPDRDGHIGLSPWRNQE